MIDAGAFVEQLRGAGFHLYSGVPCSYLTPLIDTAIDAPGIRFVNAANEGEAVAVCCGAELGGVRGVAMFQNSGLGNAVSPLTSLTAIFGIPVLVIVTWRGQPGGPEDEPQHKLMGRITPELLDLMGISWELFPSTMEDVPQMIQRAQVQMDQHGQPYALLMEKGAVSNGARSRSSQDRCASPPCFTSDRELPVVSAKTPLDADDVLRTVQTTVEPTAAVLATTGFTGRALYGLDDRPNQLYMVGSMGCVSSLGLGLAIAQPDRRVIVLDGDGAALMRMGALAAVGCQRPKNLTHVLLDNGVHDSTGAQATLSDSICFAEVARACGYPRAITVHNLGELAAALRDNTRDLTFVHVRTLPRTERKLPRPTVTPHEVAERFRAWLKANPSTPATRSTSAFSTHDNSAVAAPATSKI